MSESTPKPKRRPLGRVLAEMHYELRTEAGTPWRRAVAVGLGTFIGCLPVYGAHLILCFGIARLLRVSRITTYLAAHINNPLTAPFLLYLELVAGHWILSGRLPPVTLAHLRDRSWSGIGSELVVGSIAVGFVLAAATFAVALFIGKRRGRWLWPAELREATSRRYVDGGIFDWEFVRGKLRLDPFYMALLRQGLLPRTGTLLDLGCGRGIALALVAAAEQTWRADRWVEWPPPPLDLELIGLERKAKHARVAGTALGPRGRIVVEDLATAQLPRADVVLLADVLHYLPQAQQADLIRRAAVALRPGGRILIRECDASGGLRFAMTRLQERTCALFRGAPRQRFHYRGADEWRELLEQTGLKTGLRPMSAGTPYANVLVEGRKSEAAECSTNENSGRRGTSGITR